MSTLEAIKWVGQEDRNGCAIAVAAMMVSCSYREAKAYFLQKQPGAGDHPIGGYEFQEFVKGYGWEQCGHQYGPLWGDYGSPISFIEGAEVTHCSVVPCYGARFHHAVIMLPDGSILDPNYPEPLASIDCYHAISTAEGWKRRA